MKRTALVSEKGQVTIPKPLRRSLGLAPGTLLAFEERAGKLVASRVDAADPIDDLLATGVEATSDAFLRRTRGAPFERDKDGSRR